MENSPTSFAGNSVVVGLNDFKFGMETRFVVLLAISKFGQIDCSLHNHVFDDIICKPPIQGSRQGYVQGGCLTVYTIYLVTCTILKLTTLKFASEIFYSSIKVLRSIKHML